MFKPRSQVQILVQQFSSSFGLPFAQILPVAMLEETLKEEKLKYRERLFSPIVTLWAFLSQVLDADKTCHNAVSRIIAWLAAKGEKIPSEDNSANQPSSSSITRKLCEKTRQKNWPKLRKRSQKRKTLVWASCQSF
ncbi:MAG: hypothetical protein QNJ41_16100 [Xenococcaceae cyanobacterium MO_188.B32]|nr:hypothetical protein [Xenococcaceae cyanobacterium MO_188.B32]